MVGRYVLGRGAFDNLAETVGERVNGTDDRVVYLVDHYFRDQELCTRLAARDTDRLVFVDTTDEPTTEQVDTLTEEARGEDGAPPVAVVGVGGGSTLDVAKAVSNLLANGGRAADYQGWDLLAKPGVFKVGVPTLSGTGAEASRTCVMMNHARNLKLGMNSDYSVFDRLVLDPDLTETVPRDQYFHSGMDAYIHCIESLGGRYRHAMSDALSHQALALCREHALIQNSGSDHGPIDAQGLVFVEIRSLGTLVELAVLLQ